MTSPRLKLTENALLILKTLDTKEQVHVKVKYFTQLFGTLIRSSHGLMDKMEVFTIGYRISNIFGATTFCSICMRLIPTGVIGPTLQHLIS